MLSKMGGRQFRALFTAETAARAPLPLAPVPPGEAPAALASPPFDLPAMLAAHSYSDFSPSGRPSYQQVDAVRKRVKSTGFPVP